MNDTDDKIIREVENKILRTSIFGTFSKPSSFAEEYFNNYIRKSKIKSKNYRQDEIVESQGVVVHEEK